MQVEKSQVSQLQGPGDIHFAQRVASLFIFSWHIFGPHLVPQLDRQQLHTWQAANAESGRLKSGPPGGIDGREHGRRGTEGQETKSLLVIKPRLWP